MLQISNVYKLKHQQGLSCDSGIIDDLFPSLYIYLHLYMITMSYLTFKTI